MSADKVKTKVLHELIITISYLQLNGGGGGGHMAMVMK